MRGWQTGPTGLQLPIEATDHARQNKQNEENEENEEKTFDRS